MKKFKAQHGHCEVGLAAGTDDELVSWVRKQRSSKAQGKLDLGRQAQLDALGFSWVGGMNDHKWDEMYQRLKSYHAHHGNADVPHRGKEDRKLAAWVGHQRQRRKKELISYEEIQLLEALGFTWQHRERGSWEDRLAEVAAFKAKNGHCKIPLHYPDNPRLGRFVNNMRSHRNSGKLPTDRIAKLDALGFLWEASRTRDVDGERIDAAWMARLGELLDYKKTHGDCDVPVKWRENPQLGHWVSQQRQNRKNGALNPAKQRRLDEIGFDWRSEIRKADWETRFEQLKTYKDRFGSCRVPARWKENPQLGMWATNQHQYLKAGKLSAEKEKLLRDLSFE